MYLFLTQLIILFREENIIRKEELHSESMDILKMEIEALKLLSEKEETKLRDISEDQSFDVFPEELQLSDEEFLIGLKT